MQQINLSKRGNLRYLDELRPLAKNNRNNMTDSEKSMWEQILRNKMTGYLFLRQKPLGKYIADFYCRQLLLIIEIDGNYHNERKNSDEQRDIFFKNTNIKTIRYKNQDIKENIMSVKNNLEQKIKIREQELKQSPFFKGR